MHGITAAAAYVPHHRLRRDAITGVLGGRGAAGTRAVASYDEDTTTLAVAAARLALRAAPPVLGRVTFATTSPAYVDRTNATAIHAALRLPDTVAAYDFGGASRSAMGALLTALDARTSTLVTVADIRIGLPGGPDETEGGDAAAAIVVGEGSADNPVIAEVLGVGSATDEFIDRWRTPGEATTKRWEERFAETRYVPLAHDAIASACAAADVAVSDVDRTVVTGLHARAVRRVEKDLSASSLATDTRTQEIGNPGAAQALLCLVDVLQQAQPGTTILVVNLADGADAVVLRTTEAISDWRSSAPEGSDVAAQVAAGDDRLPYATYLSWRGLLTMEPPRRPEHARTSATAAARATDWKFGFVGSRETSSGAIHLPPSRVSFDGGEVDEMVPVPMADTRATIVTFTVDHLAYSPSPPTVFAVLDFDGGGRTACALTDVDATTVAIGDRVEMTFRRLGSADGIVNYFWKARPVDRGGRSTAAPTGTPPATATD